MRTLSLLSILVATIVVSTACSRCGGDDGAGADASPDAPRDATRERGVDADAGIPDASQTDGPLSDWPGWKRVDLQGLNCPLDVAINPISVVPQVQWIPCTDGRPNCQEMDGTAFSPEVIKFADGSFSKDGRTFLLVHYLKADIVAQFDVFDTKTLAPLAAWRVDYTNAAQLYCDVRPQFTPTKLGALYSTAIGAADGGQISRAIDVDTPAALMAAPSPTALNVNGDSTSFFDLSDTTFVFNMAFSTSIVRGVTSTAAVVRTTWPHQLVAPAIAVSDDSYATNQHGTGDGWYREAQIAGDGSVTIFREATQRHITAMATDATDWYWAESYGVNNPDETITQPAVEIYTAPYTNNSATLDETKQKLATLPPGLPFEAVSSAGHYIVQAISGQNEVFRASDGHRTSVLNQGSGWCWLPLFASDTEFWCIESAGQKGAHGVKVTKLQLPSW